MTREEYMSNVREKLSNCPEDFRNDIESEFERHFDEGHKVGKSDEEIIAELGDITDLINDLPEMSEQTDDKCENKEETSSEHYNKSAHNNDFNFRNFSFGDLRFDELGKTISKMVNDDILQNLKKTIKESIKYGSHTANNFAKNFNNDEGSLSAEGTLENISNFHTVKVEGGCLDLNVTRGEALHYEYICQTNSPKLAILYENDTIRFTRDVSENSPIFNSGLSGTLTLTIPENFNHINVTVGAGDIDVSHISLKRINAVTGSGSLNAENVTAKEFCTTTGSGDVSITGSNITKSVFSTGSGDIDIKKSRVESVDFSSGSGDIVTHADIKNISFRSGSGDIDLITASQIERCDINTASGDARLDLGASPSYDLVFKTVSGDISTKMPYYKDGNAITIKNGGFASINVRTVSGDLEIV
jgi:DUF4097 and DUF4098 domain-containing protein YvlB